MAQVKDKSRKETPKAANEEPAAKAANGLAEAGRQVTAGERHRMIAEAAYFIALQRGFADGDAFDDWVLAERQIDQTLLVLPTQASAQRGSETVAGKAGAQAIQPFNKATAKN